MVASGKQGGGVRGFPEAACLRASACKPCKPCGCDAGLLQMRDSGFYTCEP